MVISERQVMQLMDFCQSLLHRMIHEQAPIPVIDGLGGLLNEIACQQSDELFVTKAHCDHEWKALTVPLPIAVKDWNEIPLLAPPTKIMCGKCGFIPV
jgi:hypothetical protein